MNKNINYYSIIKNWHTNKEIMYTFSSYSLVCGYSLLAKQLSILLICSFTQKEEKIININDIIFLFNSSINNFKDFYNEQADNIISKNPDIVGIQITSGDAFFQVYTYAT